MEAVNTGIPVKFMNPNGTVEEAIPDRPQAYIPLENPDAIYHHTHTPQMQDKHIWSLFQTNDAQIYGNIQKNKSPQNITVLFKELSITTTMEPGTS